MTHRLLFLLALYFSVMLLLTCVLLPMAHCYERATQPRLDNLTEAEARCAKLYWKYTVTSRVERLGEQSGSYGDHTRLGYHFMVPLTARLAGITYVGHSARLRLLLERLRLGESIIMGALGGSITFGQGIGGRQFSYAEYFSHWLDIALPPLPAAKRPTRRRRLADRPLEHPHQREQEGGPSALRASTPHDAHLAMTDTTLQEQQQQFSLTFNRRRALSHRAAVGTEEETLDQFDVRSDSGGDNSGCGDIDGGSGDSNTQGEVGSMAGGWGSLRHEFINGAVPGTQSGYMSSCLTHHLPRDVDLVLVEYAVNDPPTPSKNLGDPDRRAFERLIRKLLSLPSRPAVVLVNMFANLAAHGKYWLTAERDFTEVATYYGLPSVSLRSAVLPAALSGDDSTPAAACLALNAIFNSGRYHPGRGGHVVVMELLITMFMDLLHSNTRLRAPTTVTPAGTALHTSGGDQLHMSMAWHGNDVDGRGGTSGRGHGDVGLDPGALAALEAVAFRPLPPPLSEGNYEAAEGTCYIEHELKALVEQPVVGWEWTDEGRGKWGWVTTLPQQHLRIQLNTQLPGNRSEVEASTKIIVQLAYLQSYEGMGSVQVTCVSGCSCEEVLVDGWDKRTVSVTAMKDMQVSQSPACLLLLTSMGPGRADKRPDAKTEQQGPEGGHERGDKFKLLGVVVGEEPGATEGTITWFRPESHAMSQRLRGGGVTGG